MTISVPLLLSYIVSTLLMIGLPIVLAVVVTRRFKISWWVVLTGVLTFAVAQALHYPALLGLNAGFQNGIIPTPPEAWIPLVYSVLLGFLAALFEESTRYIGFKLLRKKIKKFGSALALGVGHGGFESILTFALGTAVTLFTVLFYNAGAQIAKGVSPDQVQYTLAQISQFWATPFHFGLLPGVERVIAITTQIFLSTLVWKAVIDRSFVWFAVAFVYHMVIDTVAQFLQYSGWSYWKIEGVLAIFMILNIFLIYRFIKEESQIEKEMAEITDEEFDEDDDDEFDDEDSDENDDEEDIDVDEDIQDKE